MNWNELIFDDQLPFIKQAELLIERGYASDDVLLLAQKIYNSKHLGKIKQNEHKRI